MKNRTLNTATLVAIFSLAILVMASCGNNKPSAPAEKVVNLNELPTLYSAGSDTTVTTCTAADFRWMDCEGVFHPGTKFVPKQGTHITLQGEKADLSKALGLTDSNELVIRDKAPGQMKAKTSPTPVTKRDPKPTTGKSNDNTSTFELGDLPWHWLGWIFLLGVLLCLGFLFFGMLRRLAHWMFEPLARRQGDGNHAHTEHVNQAPVTPATNGPDTTRNVTTIHNEAERPNMSLNFKGEGEHAMSFNLTGQFSLPLQVKVTKGDETPTVVDFGRPTGHSESSGENRSNQR